MSLLMRAREVVGRPVVTLDTAEDVAEVRDVVFSHTSSTLVGFTLNARGMLGSPMDEALPWAHVSSLGRDAVMIASADAIGEDGEAMAGAAGHGERDVIGATVITEGGTELGEVVDVIVEVAGEARVVGFEVRAPDASSGRERSTLLIPTDETISVSGDALMVPAAVEDFVRDDLSGFGSAIAEYRARLREETPR